VKIYVASSWRNQYQPGVVMALRDAGHEVYDFRGIDGFHWSEIDPDWLTWTPSQYLVGLNHEFAHRGFNRDFNAMKDCDACVYVMPCGPSASMEMGWFAGKGRPVVVYIPELREPDLMVKMADFITTDLNDVIKCLARC